jgi:hypothetical protein
MGSPGAIPAALAETEKVDRGRINSSVAAWRRASGVAIAVSR